MPPGREIVLIVGRDEVITDGLLDRFQEALDTGLDVLVGTQTEELRTQIAEALPDAEVFVSGLEWLHSSPLEANDDTTISRLLLIDKNTILVSSVHETDIGEIETEKAVFRTGIRQWDCSDCSATDGDGTTTATRSRYDCGRLVFGDTAAGVLRWEQRERRQCCGQ